MKTKSTGWTMVMEEGVKKMRLDVNFADFNEAFGFIGRVALLSETLNHHAEIYNLYNKVRIQLYSHESKSVTVTDKKMAKLVYKMLT